MPLPRMCTGRALGRVDRHRQRTPVLEDASTSRRARSRCAANHAATRTPAANDKGEDRRQHAKSRTASASAHSASAGVRSRRPKIIGSIEATRSRMRVVTRSPAPVDRHHTAPSDVASPATPVKAAKVSTVAMNTTRSPICRRPSPSTMSPMPSKAAEPANATCCAWGADRKRGAELRDARAARAGYRH